MTPILYQNTHGICFMRWLQARMEIQTLKQEGSGQVTVYKYNYYIASSTMEVDGNFCVIKLENTNSQSVQYVPLNMYMILLCEVLFSCTIVPGVLISIIYQYSSELLQVEATLKDMGKCNQNKTTIKRVTSKWKLHAKFLGCTKYSCSLVASLQVNSCTLTCQ